MSRQSQNITPIENNHRMKGFIQLANHDLHFLKWKSLCRQHPRVKKDVSFSVFLLQVIKHGEASHPSCPSFR